MFISGIDARGEAVPETIPDKQERHQHVRGEARRQAQHGLNGTPQLFKENNMSAFKVFVQPQHHVG